MNKRTTNTDWITKKTLVISGDYNEDTKYVLIPGQCLKLFDNNCFIEEYVEMLKNQLNDNSQEIEIKKFEKKFLKDTLSIEDKNYSAIIDQYTEEHPDYRCKA